MTRPKGGCGKDYTTPPFRAVPREICRPDIDELPFGQLARRGWPQGKSTKKASKCFLRSGRGWRKEMPGRRQRAAKHHGCRWHAPEHETPWAGTNTFRCRRRIWLEAEDDRGDKDIHRARRLSGVFGGLVFAGVPRAGIRLIGHRPSHTRRLWAARSVAGTAVKPCGNSTG